jgi:hypothetical protein
MVYGAFVYNDTVTQINDTESEVYGAFVYNDTVTRGMRSICL